MKLRLGVLVLALSFYAAGMTYGLRTVPASLRAAQIVTPPAHGATLTWNPQAGMLFNVYRSEIKGQGYVKITPAPLANPTFEDKNVLVGHTYYYVVRTVNSAGTESVNSLEVGGTVRPFPPGTPTGRKVVK